MFCRLTVLPQKVTLEAEKGTNLLERLRKAGLAPPAPCGGHGKCGKCLVTVNGKKVLACKTTVDGNMTVELPEYEKTEILMGGETSAVALDPVKPGHLVAFDIGTTTVVCFLLSPEGRELAAESMLNPQSPYGADVISRMQQALGGRLMELADSIRSGMSDLIEKCCETAGISPEKVSVISVVGNPCMQQLFMGIDPGNLAAIPFAPVLTKPEIRPAKPYLSLCPNAVLLVVPDISGYVGADTMGCVLATRMQNAKDTVLMVDIGTNGEMVLQHKGRMAACSTAAGPALEGANIRFGMRGAAGAIDHVRLENGEIRCSVIGGGEPIGICGSGIIDAVAVLLEKKCINRRGRIQSTEELDGQRIARLTERIFLTQDDVRQVQLAKGAIAAGIHLMCAHLGITPAEVDQVILAGAFGSFMDPKSACRIGLLPPELSGKIRAAGNIAGTGAIMLAKNQGQLTLTQELVNKIEFIELADQPGFQKAFAKHMTFSE